MHTIASSALIKYFNVIAKCKETNKALFFTAVLYSQQLMKFQYTKVVVVELQISSNRPWITSY
jgi:hypothetical protein